MDVEVAKESTVGCIKMANTIVVHTVVQNVYEVRDIVCRICWVFAIVARLWKVEQPVNYYVALVELCKRFHFEVSTPFRKLSVFLDVVLERFRSIVKVSELFNVQLNVVIDGFSYLRMV